MRRGFAILELLVVLGIVGVVTGIAVPLYNEYQIRSDLNIATEQTVQGLARARLLSQSAKDDSQWGFYVPAGTLYRGESYADRDENSDEIYPMPSTVAISGIFEVNYSKSDAIPNETGSIVLRALSGEERSIEIVVDRSGVPMNVTDIITICYEEETLNVPDSQWSYYQQQGATVGPCVSSSSSSSVTSQSSESSSSSEGGGEGGGGGGGETCEDRFVVEADGTIRATGPVSMTVNALGSEITYGAGGPPIPVYLRYSTTYNENSGKFQHYEDLFDEEPIAGGETEVVSGIEDGDRISIEIKGEYKFLWWLTFRSTVYSHEDDGQVIILRDGDPLPDYEAFDGQEPLTAFLDDIVDESNNIDIGAYDAVLLVELSDVDSETADFQDAVILLTFDMEGTCP